jgi:dipeptidyl-peptidase 4
MNEIKIRKYDLPYKWIEYISRCGYIKNTPWLEFIDRKQEKRTIAILKGDEFEVIYEEEISEYWINVSDIFYEYKNGVIISSEKTGFRHLYHVDFENGYEVSQLTDGEWGVKSIWVDEENEIIYFTGTKDSFIENHLYKLNFKNLKIER